MSLNNEDKKYLARDASSYGIEIVKSQDSFLVDAKGNKFIDFLMGWCVGNLGWSNKHLHKAVQNFKGPTYVMPKFLYKPWVELSSLLAEITPGNLTKCFRATGGTEAVEIALRAANAYTKRAKFISIKGCYHGNSVMETSLTPQDYKKHHKGLLDPEYQITPPLNDEAIDQVEKLLKQKDVAALIMEPIICNLGVLIPENNFMKRAAELCKKYGSLFIVDEVATGFGRTGTLFASEHFKIKPDIMCLAKALTGGYGGMGAAITTKEVAKAMEYESSYYSTYGWHPLSVAAAIANIKFFQKNGEEIAENTAMIGEYFKLRLLKMNFKYDPTIRQIGLAICIEFPKGKKYGNKVVDAARKKHLLIAANNDDQIMMFPALTITKNVAKQGLDILEKCL